MVKPLEKAGCMELRTAGLIIGWLGVIGSVLTFCFAAFTLEKSDQIVDYLSTKNGEKARLHDQAAFFVFWGMVMGASILGAVISGFLIYGIEQIRHSMLLPWLMLGTFSLVLRYSQLSIYLWDFVAGSHNFLVFLLQVFSIGLNTYIYYVIFSLYTHMKMGSGNGCVLAPPPAAAVLLQQTVPTAYPNNAAYPTIAAYPLNTAYASNAAYPPTTYPTYNKV